MQSRDAAAIQDRHRMEESLASISQLMEQYKKEHHALLRKVKSFAHPQRAN
jgi:hypothetical protein